MKRLLINLFYDGYSLDEAIDFITRNYEEEPTQKQIESAKKSILECNLIEWR